MASPFDTPEFRALFTQWNQILKDAGHNEIEDFSQADPTLIDYVSTRWRTSRDGTDNHHGHAHPLQLEAKRAYYEMADVLLKTHPFKSDEQRRIWECHCRGLSARAIADALSIKKHRKSTVATVIVTIQREAGLRND